MASVLTSHLPEDESKATFRVPSEPELQANISALKTRLRSLRRVGDPSATPSTLYMMATIHLARLVHDDIGHAIDSLEDFLASDFGPPWEAHATIPTYYMNLLDATAAVVALRMRPAPNRTSVRHAAIKLLATLDDEDLAELLEAFRSPPEEYTFAVGHSG